MKVLILAMPRTASKFTSRTLQNYFNWQRTPVDQVYRTINVFYDGLRNMRIKLIDNQFVSTGEPLTDFMELVENRIECIEQYKGNGIFKIHHSEFIDRPDLIDKLIATCDHVILLKRKNEFEQLLSHALAEYHNAWHQNAKLNDKLTNEPIHIDPLKFIHKIKLLKKCNDYIPPDNVTILNSEDICNAETREEICQLLNLPVKRFYQIPNTIEFGQNKFDMISNIDELTKLFNER